MGGVMPVPAVCGGAIETLVTSNDLASINSLIPVLFTKLRQIKNNRYYSLPRFVDFVYVISVDVTRKCISFLENQRILFSSSNEKPNIFKKFKQKK